MREPRTVLVFAGGRSRSESKSQTLPQQESTYHDIIQTSNWELEPNTYERLPTIDVHKPNISVNLTDTTSLVREGRALGTAVLGPM